MERKGADQVMWIVVAGIVFLIVAVLVSLLAGGDLLDFDQFIRGNLQSSDFNLCETKVSNFCDRESNTDDGADWGTRYPECVKFAGDLDTTSSDTSCPLGVASSGGGGGD